MDLDDVLNWISPPPLAKAEAAAVLPQVLAGKADPRILESVYSLFLKLDNASRGRLIFAFCEKIPEKVDAEIRGIVLREGLSRSRVASLLREEGYSMAMIIRWVVAQPPETIMDDLERAAFDKLADPVTLYRGGHGRRRKAAAGLLWTPDFERARLFTYQRSRLFEQSAILVSAEFPKDAVLTYLSYGDGADVVVNYRRARKIRALVEFQPAGN